MKNLNDLLAEKDIYDPESQRVLESISFNRAEIEMLNAMKQTEGWKLMDTKIRQELQARMHQLVKEDAQVQTLLALLVTAETKNRSQQLDEEIKRILPE